MERTIGYRIESCMIPQTPGISRRRWFLDRIFETERGRGASNICNGDESYCLAELKRINDADEYSDTPQRGDGGDSGELQPKGDQVQ